MRLHNKEKMGSKWGKHPQTLYLRHIVEVQIPATPPQEKSRNLSKGKCDFFAIYSLKPKNIAE